MKHNPYEIIKIFEEIVAEYCGSKYAVAVDNATNGLFLCMKYLKLEGEEITIPARTFMSVPCAIIHAGNKVKFDKNHSAIQGKKLKGQYKLDPFPIWDSALTFKKDMYIPGQFQCLSFSGPHKFLKLGKGGMILTDNEDAYMWLKRAAYFGRRPIDHKIEKFDMLGWNYYMLPEIAARGSVLMLGMKDHNDDLAIEYQDLSIYKVYTEAGRE
jgi:dTDP-4-amino-4,6-dideoxygalactose transaminase